MCRTLYGKLVAVLLGMGAIMAVTFAVVIYTADHARRQEVTQKFYRTLASRLVDEDFVEQGNTVDYRNVQTVFDRLRVVNPKIDVYLLDENGRILAYSGRSEVPARNAVDMEPIRRFLGNVDDLPITGDDPVVKSGKRIFSVAPISLAGQPRGYLYLVLRGLSLENGIAEQLKNSYVLRGSMLLVIGGVLFALLASALIVKFIMRPLRQLAAITGKFQQSGFAEYPAQPLPRRAADGDEIECLTGAFVQMSDRILAQMQELQRTDAMRRELIANISHDLRTPLASLQGYLETLQFKHDSLSAEDRRNYLDVALRQSGQLSQLVAKLFELAKLDTGQVTVFREPFVLEDLVQDVVQQFELAASNKQVRLVTDLPAELPLVVGDIGLIERVFKNLIDNSMRYTPPGGSVTVTLTPAEHRVLVRVTDTGSGISAEDLPRVFDRFYRGEKSRSDASGNAGLGLAIAKRILELHESSIEVSSTPGVATTVSFSLVCAGTGELQGSDVAGSTGHPVTADLKAHAA